MTTPKQTPHRRSGVAGAARNRAKAKRKRAVAKPKPAKTARKTATRAGATRAGATRAGATRAGATRAVAKPKPAKTARKTATRAVATRAGAKPKPAKTTRKVATRAGAKRAVATRAVAKPKPAKTARKIATRAGAKPKPAKTTRKSAKRARAKPRPAKTTRKSAKRAVAKPKPAKTTRKSAKRARAKPRPAKTTRQTSKAPPAAPNRPQRASQALEPMAPVTLDAAAPLASQTVSAAPSSPAMEPPLAGKRELPPGVRVGRWGARGEGGSPPPGFGAVPTLAESARRALPLPMRATAKREPFSTERWPEIDEAAKRLGIERLTTEQRHAIRALLEGRDLLVALPAGAGKTSAALVAALLTRQPTLLVSPLISAQRDLHDRLHARRAPVVRVDPGIFGEERKRALARFTATEPLVVLTTPESLSSDDLTSALARSGIGFVAVEDAECTSEWAHEYRPAHAELGRALERLGSPQVAALCAPSVAAVRHDVAERLALRAPLVLAGDPVRANLALDATEARGEVRQRTLVSLVMRLERPGIVYCATPREVDAVHGALRALRVPVHRYHGELPAGERAGEQLNFLLPGRRAVMVATSGFAPSTGFAGLGELGRLELTPAGFGRGLEKRDTRFVIHYQAPASLEQYLRELGAAGRDGKPASAILLYDPADRGYHDAALARARLRPAHVLELARALESSALDGRAASLESLALATRQSRRNAELVAAVLADAGLVDLAPGWARAAVAGVELFERARRVAGALETLAREDGRRLDAVAAYARSAGCRTLHLGRYLGMSDTVECGRCSACDAAAFDGRRFAPLTEPAPGRRAAPRSFEVTRLDVSRPSSAPLTAKLGEFVG